MPPKKKVEKVKKTEDSEPSVPKSKKPKNDETQNKLTNFITKETKSNYDLGDGKFTKDQIMISSWNVNGLRAVLGKNELNKYIEKCKPDVFCLNETKIDKESLDSQQIGKQMPKDYHQYWNCCKSQKGYSGVAIFSLCKPISVKEDIGISEHDQEGRTLTLEFDKFYLISCYVPNAGQKLVRLDYRTQKWDPAFRNYLNELNKKKHVIWCGDLNVAHHEIDISNPKGNLRSAGFTIEERNEFTKLLDMGFVDTFRKLYPKEIKYSYWSMRSAARKENKGWRLDYFITNPELFEKGVKDSKINNEIMGSDHCPIELELNIKNI